MWGVVCGCCDGGLVNTVEVVRMNRVSTAGTMVASLLEQQGLFFLMVSNVLQFLMGGWTSGGSSLAGDEFNREDSKELLSSVAEVSALFLVSVPLCLYSLHCMHSDLCAVE